VSRTLPDYSSWRPEKVAQAAVRYAESLAEDATPYADEAEADVDEGADSFIRQTIDGGEIDLAWALVREYLRASPDERLRIHAVGHLEDLVRQRGAECVAEVEREARTDERFRWALGSIWIHDPEFAPEIVDRFVAASDGVLRVFRNGEN
jgi:hypothetical protein